MKTSVFDEAIHSFGAPPRFPSAGALTDIVFKMAPAYKFALIQMQPKVSQSVASYLQRALIVSPIYMIFAARCRLVEASYSLA